MEHWQRRVIVGFVLGLAVVLVVILLADLPKTLAAFARWQWAFLPVALAFTAGNYALRFLRWHYYLRVLGIRDVPWGESLLVFLAGFTMTMTPGKLGEVLKSFLLKQSRGRPLSETAPIVVAERLTDVLAMVMLASLGLATIGPAGWPALLLVLIICVAFIVVVQSRRLSLPLLRWGARLPLVGRFAASFQTFYESSYRLLRPVPLLVALGLALAAWFGECLTFLVVVLGGFAGGSLITPELLLQTTFVYAGASLLGAVSFLPGGLGVTEGGMAMALVTLLGLSAEDAAAATLLTRFCTLWFAVFLGLGALVIFQRQAVRGTAEDGR